ncbi:MAG TPA: AtpZ/AtpI family protein [Anseongella sp.]
MKEPEKEQPKKRGFLRSYARFSAVGFQMLVIIGGLTWLGIKMDEWWQTDPTFTAILSLSSVGIALYVVYKQLRS